MSNKTYIAIDLKSFYASVECISRGLDPMTTNLVVADEARTEKTICLAVSPSLREYGISGRARLFEVSQTVRQINARRRYAAPNKRFSGKSYKADEIKRNPSLELSYLVAAPRMALYKQISVKIYQTYLKYVAPEDIHVYSIDEVFIDASAYLPLYKTTPRELATIMISDVMKTTGITAAAGIGSNMYLCKVAMDIMAKREAADKNGVCIAELDEIKYRRELWSHRPLTDFWRVGCGYAAKLEKHGIYTMGDIARCSIGEPHEYYNEELLYKLFGVNAELLIDHAWGWEPCGMADIKAYKPESSSSCSGQVLKSPYSFDKALLVLKEMAESTALDLVDKGLATDQITLDVGYDARCLSDSKIKSSYRGATTRDYYGRLLPKHAHGTENIGRFTSSTKLITDSSVALFERIVDRSLLVRRLTLTVCHLVNEENVRIKNEYSEQLGLFTDYEHIERKRARDQEALNNEKKIQRAVIDIKKKFGKNAILKGRDLEDGATAVDRNSQIGGHKA